MARRYQGEAQRCPLDDGLLTDMGDPFIGKVIHGKYQIVSMIGAGGMGRVYRARHVLLDKDVAVKFLDRQLARDADHRERFLREAKAASRIAHPHIVDINDIGHLADDVIYLVMELLEGQSLADLIAQGPAPLQRALNITLQASTALARAHELGVIHRDIKPDNIFVTRRSGADFVKILDFGLALVRGQRRLTAAGSVFGSPEYMSPEQARGQQVSGATDLYSLGCVLFELLTGQPAFGGEVNEILNGHLFSAPPLPSDFIDALPVSVDSVVTRLMAKDPSERFTDAYHLSEELRRMLSQITRTIPLDASSVRPARPSKRPDMGLSVGQRWLDRLASLSSDALPPGGNSRDVSTLLSRLHERAQDVVHMEHALRQHAERALHLEGELRATRERVGQAIDTLGADESRLRREVSEAEQDVERIGERDRIVRDELEKHCVPLVAVLSSSGGRPDADAAEVIAAAGAAARRWLNVLEEREAAGMRVEQLTGQLQDLGFQMDQLRGRLGSLGAEEDVDLGRIREQASLLDAQIERELRSIERLAGELGAIDDLPPPIE